MSDLDLSTIMADGTLVRRTAPAFQFRDPDQQRHVSAARLLVAMSRLAAEKPLDPIGEATQSSIDAACTIYVAQGNETWTGSGFLITSGVILTNSHVIPQESEGADITVSFDGQNMLPATVVAINPDVDAAALQVQGVPDVRPVPLAIAGAKPGEIIAVIGAPEGWQDVVTVGRVSAVDRSPDQSMGPAWEEMMFVDADILEGSSGSMVIDITGKVIGMVMGMIGKHAQDRGLGQRAVIPIHRVIAGLGL